MRTMKSTVLIGLALAVACVMAIVTGCAQQEPVAATVNGDNIEEKSITSYIENFRDVNNLSDEKTWAQWLVDNNRTAADLRNDAIDYYVRITVIGQDAKAKGIEVSDADVDAQLTEIKDYYGYDDEQFKKQIENIGYTEESYKEYIKQSLTQEKLMDATSDDVSASDDEVLNMANNYTSILNGAKKVKCIAISKDKSTDAVDIQKEASASGADFDSIAEKNTASTDYDGWDMLVPMDQAVADKIATMGKGDVSDVIEGTDWLFIVKVEDVCTVGDDGFTSIDQVPDELKHEFKENVEASAKSSAFETYVQSLIDNANIQINDMPKGLPYDVSTEGITPTAGSAADTANANTTTSADGSGIQIVDEDGNPVEGVEVTTNSNSNANSNSSNEG